MARSRLEYERTREAILTEAVRSGKISVCRRPFYRNLYDNDPVATQRLIAALAPARTVA
jgi:hypothetical protein